MSSLESYLAGLFEWFSNNQMKVNPENGHILMNVNRLATIKICEHTLYETVIAKNCLVLRSIVNSILTIILKKLLKTPVRRYMFWLESGFICIFQKKVINECFSMNNYINRLHERCLRILFIMKKRLLLQIY